MNFKVGFVGAGNIAKAILTGSLNSGYIKSENIYIYDIDKKKLDVFSTFGVNICKTANSLLKNCDIVFLTVKPQCYGEVIEGIKNDMTEQKCIVDVGAGVTIDFVRKAFGFECKVVRVMPNTPIMYSNGTAGVVKSANVSDEEFNFVKGFFDSNGISCEVKEDLIDVVTGVSGSSPAFVFRFAKAIIDAGIERGLSSEAAEKLAVNTIIGSAQMIEKSPLSITELIRMVASPNGTTEAGLKFLDDSGFDSSVYGAVLAAIDRAVELKQ